MREARFIIRAALPEEFSTIGRLAVGAYSSLPEMPTVEDQPDYYERIRDVAKRVSNPAIRVFAAIDDSGRLLGCVDFIEDMRHYGSAGTACSVSDAVGIRLLAVKPEARGKGVGKALTLFCIHEGARLRKSKVILHTTRSMRTAWDMYERIGFERYPDIDFMQGNLAVFGLRLNLTPDR